MYAEFKKFLMRGSVLDLAVGIVMGAAFSKIVSSFVADVLMPPIGMILGQVDFSQLFISLNGTHYETLDAAKKAGAPTLNYGLFINSIIDFVIIAFSVFLVIKAVNRLQKPAPITEATTRDCPECCSTIALKARRCPNCTAQLA